MTDFSDEHLAARLRVLLSDAGISIREAAEATNVPYRTLQNQLAGKNRMPASTFARLTEMLEVTPGFVATGRLRLGKSALADAIQATLGELLPVVDPDYVLKSAADPDERSVEEKSRDAKFIAFVLADRYELHHARLRFPHYEKNTDLEH